MNSAREELADLSASLQSSNPNGTDTGGTHATLEDGAATLAKESIHQLAGRQQKFIQQLEAALGRIANKNLRYLPHDRRIDPKGKITGSTPYHPKYGGQTQAALKITKTITGLVRQVHLQLSGLIFILVRYKKN